MQPLHFRTQQEILDRIHDAISRGDQGDEFNEYMRCAKFIPLVLRSVYEDTDEADWTEIDIGLRDVTCEDARDIDATAKAQMAHFERAIRRIGGPNRVATMVHQFRAWKWLLGHEDADKFLSYLEGAEVYGYLLRQMSSGEWDRMTKDAKKRQISARLKRDAIARKEKNATFSFELKQAKEQVNVFSSGQQIS